MRPGFHQWLVFLGTALGLWAFGLGAGLLLPHLDGPGWLWPLVFVAAILGAGVGRWLMRQIATRCPSCGGRAYYEVGPRHGSHFPIQYRCLLCGDVHRTGWNEGK
jgi:hypothetical protein